MPLSCRATWSVTPVIFLFAATLLAQPDARTDQHGDVLPADVQARAGAIRLQHGAPVIGLAFSPDGKFVASASRDNTVRVWDRVTGAERHRLPHDWASVVAFSPDGKTVVSGADNGSIRIWELQGGKLPRNIRAHAGRVTALLFSPDGQNLSSAGLDGSTSTWHIGSDDRRVEGIVDQVVCLAGSADGTLMAAGGIDLKLFKGGTLLHTIPAEKKVRCLAFRKDGKLLAAGCEDGTIRLIDPLRGSDDKTLKGHAKKVTFVAFAPDGKTLVSTAADRTVRLWNVAEGRAERTVNLATIPTTAALSPDGTLLAVPGLHHRIDLFETATAKPAVLAVKRLAPVTSLVAAADGKRLFAGCADGTLRVLDADTGKQLSEVGEETAGDVFLARSEDGKRFAVSLRGQPVQLLDAATLKELRTLPNPAGTVSVAVAFSADARLLAVRYHNQETDEGLVRLWDAEKGTEARNIAEKGAGVSSVAFTPDGTLVALARENLGVTLWSTENGKETRRIAAGSPSSALVFSPDGRFLVIPGDDGILALHTTATGEVVRYLAGHSDPIHGLAFSPDGRLLATGGGDAAVRLWEVASGSMLGELKAHTGPVRAVVFLAGGRRLASASADATVLIWDLSGEQRRLKNVPPTDVQVVWLWKRLAEGTPLEAHEAVWQLALAPDKSVPFIREQMRALMGVDADRIEELIRQLDHNRFALRERASDELGRIIHLAGPALRRALAQNPSPELARRARELLDKLKNPLSPEIERLRNLRALEILEKAGTADARKLLEEVAGKVSDAEVKLEARLAVGRLAKREPK